MAAFFVLRTTAVTQTAIYVGLGMVLAWFIQMHFGRHGRRFRNWRERVWASLVCSFLTAAIALPLFDFYPELPPSLALLVGCGVGFVGGDGVHRVLEGLIFTRFGIDLRDKHPPSHGRKDAPTTQENKNDHEG